MRRIKLRCQKRGCGKVIAVVEVTDDGAGRVVEGDIEYSIGFRLWGIVFPEPPPTARCPKHGYQGLTWPSTMLYGS